MAESSHIQPYPAVCKRMQGMMLRAIADLTYIETQQLAHGNLT